MKTPGIRIDPLELLSEHNIYTVFFDDVRVPRQNLVGGLNQGWKLITGQLNQHPRSAIGMLDEDSKYDYVEFYDKLVADL